MVFNNITQYKHYWFNLTFRHASGAKVRLKESDFRLIDEDGNVVLVLSNVEQDAAYTCSIINEVAENTTTCAVTVTTDVKNLHASKDEDVIRHSL